MVSHMVTASAMEDLTWVERAEATIVAAADHLGLPVPDLTATLLERQLSDLAERLEEQMVTCDSSDKSTAAGELMISILRLRCELLDHDLYRRRTCLSNIRTALSELRDLSPREMIHAAPAVLSRKLAFTRTMISAVRGSMWLPLKLHIEDEEGDPRSRQFHEYVDGAHLRLADAPLETELVRRRCGAFVPSPAEDKRTFKEIVEVSGCIGYIAAPITVQGNVVGILHADRPEPDGVVSMDHLGQLEAFAECLSAAFESAVLEEKAAHQRAEVDSLRTNVYELFSGSTRSTAWSMLSDPPGQKHGTGHLRDSSPLTSLTAREHEIMSHVATGATNSQIARCLVISEDTVKSHLKHIAKKLNTSSRAAAVAVYAWHRHR